MEEDGDWKWETYLILVFMLSCPNERCWSAPAALLTRERLELVVRIERISCSSGSLLADEPGGSEVCKI